MSIESEKNDSGLQAVVAIAGYFRIAASPASLARELALVGRTSEDTDVLRLAKAVGLKARVFDVHRKSKLCSMPKPLIVKTLSGDYNILQSIAGGDCRIVDPVKRTSILIKQEAFLDVFRSQVILVTRRMGGDGVDPEKFGLHWFAPTLWRYRQPLAHVLIASAIIQIFSLVTPIFFQIVVDKVLAHHGYSTLFLLISGLVVLGLFDVILQQLRTYALGHTTSRMDVELGRRLFQHVVRLPLGYFESRPAGQTVARLHELENIRSFITGQGLFSLIDFAFTFIFIGVLFIYSSFLAWIVVFSIPCYVLTAAVFRPALRRKTEEKFQRSAATQQFLIESVVGMQTIKASAVEWVTQVQWDDRLAAYVKVAFRTLMIATLGQNIILYISKFSLALILLFGAKAVMDGEMTVGELIAFNMIAGQVIQPVLRLSQIWHDFQQVSISIDRLGDVLNTPVENRPATPPQLPPPTGNIELRGVRFSYRQGLPEVLKGVDLVIRPGEVIGIVGPSGSGKSTLTKIVQRLYTPTEGQVLVDRIDVTQADPQWLRGNIGVVLQENLLFNRSIHDNIAIGNPAMARDRVMAVARLAGADEFIARLPAGYDTVIEERGSNLSGGQRQRLAIARALATNPPILILDEATSALDYESERIVHRNMRQIVKGRTVIIIAHRLAAVRHCDRIIGMADGRIVESGSHEELVGRPGGLYAKLWRLQTNQSSGVLDDEPPPPAGSGWSVAAAAQ